MTNEPTKTETLYGASDPIPILFQDGSSGSVIVKQLTIAEFPKLAEALDEELIAIELYCEKQQGWAKSLTVESQEKIITEGERINSDFFGRWLQRRIARQERLFPGLTEKIQAGAFTSPISSPNSPSNAG